jgi:protein-tyrosine phosphatase
MFLFRRKFNLLIVCSANRTRSAYFAGYLRHCLERYRPGALRRLRIGSAGTKAMGGGRVNDVVALIARKEGFSLREHQAEPLTERKVRRANLILVMEQSHKETILERWPDARDKVFRLMEYGAQGDGPAVSLDVPDPTGRQADDFKAFIEIAHMEADRLIHELVYREVI